MSKIDTSIVWAPKVLGRDKLDRNRWAYIVEAPFDLPADVPDLIGKKAFLDGGEFEIRGGRPENAA
jgi:hypothetical protein